LTTGKAAMVSEQVGSVTLEREGKLAFITLRHSAKRNAMSRAMWVQLHSLFSSILSPYDADIGLKNHKFAGISAVVVRGAVCSDGSTHFCAGGDISEYPSFRFDEEKLRTFHEEEVAPALDAMLACDIPLIAQIDGFCMGGGLEIAACCDIRVAGQGAVFGAPIAKLGFPMAPREAAIVARAVGEATARQMLLAAHSFSAQAMLQRGFLSAVVDDAQVAAQALASAQSIAQLSPQAAALNKQTFRAIFSENSSNVSVKSSKSANETIACESLVNPYAYAATAHHIEGISAFLAKRAPQF
jgi:enoyl-CoA hydratase